MFGIQRINSTRWDQGAAPELVRVASGFAEQYPDIAAWRAHLILLRVHAGALEEARSGLEEFAADGFADIPFDYSWTAALRLAAEGPASLWTTPPWRRCSTTSSSPPPTRSSFSAQR